MKKTTAILAGLTVLALAAGLLAGAAGYKPQSVSVVTTSTLIIPAATPEATNAWAASTVVAAAEILNVASQNFWWVTSAGTTWTGAPSHYDGDATNGTATLRAIHARRAKLVLSNIGTANVFVAQGNAAEANKGLLLLANGANKLETDYQGAIYGISTAGTTNTVTVHEE